MTTKTLTGTYSAGYTIHSPVTTLSIASGGYVEGSGVSSPSSPAGSYTIANYGRIVATTTGAKGVYLGNGGVVTNGSATDVTARISGYRGVEIHKAAGTVTNYGTVTGLARTAVYLAYGGSVINGADSDTGATIRGSNGIIIDYSKADPLATVINYGTVAATDTIAADASVGVYLGAGGVDNGSTTDTTATISGYSGVEITGLGLVFNYGSIIGFGGKGSYGVYLQAGTITNGVAAQVHATIRGDIGVAEGGGSGTITNFGTIIGTGGTSVEMHSADQTLVVEPGSAFVGAVVGGGGRLELAAGVGTLSHIGGGGLIVSGAISPAASFGNFGVVQVDAPAVFTLSGGGTIIATQTLEIEGSLTTTGTLAVTGSLDVKSAGVLNLQGALTGAGDGLTLEAGATLTGRGTVAVSTLSDKGLVNAVGGALVFVGAGPGTGHVFAGVLEGTEIDFAGVETLSAGSSLTAARIGVFSGASVQLLTSQAYAGIWRQTAGTVDLRAGNLSLSGRGSTFAGVIDGTGTLSFLGGTQTLQAGASLQVSRWSIASGAVVGLQETLSYAGPLTTATGTLLGIGVGAMLNLSGTVTNLAGAIAGGGTLAVSGGVTVFRTGATLGVAKLSLLAGTVELGESLTYLGVVNQAAASSLLLGASTLTLKGTGSTFAGGIGGVGGLLLLAGGTQSFNVGAKIGVSNWSIQSHAVVSVNERLTYLVNFSLVGATLTVAKSDTFSLVGPAMFGPSALVNGAGVLQLYKATLAGLTVGGTLGLSVLGTVDQTGATTLGDATNSAVLATISKAGIWRLDGDVGISRGVSTTTRIADSGTLIKSSGTGTSVIGVTVIDGGLVEAASGTLDITQTLFGTGRLVIDAGATLELDSAVANTITLAFNGAGATLALGDAGVFHVAMSGFAAGDTIDLLGVAATSATLGTGDKLVIADGAKTVATLQLSGSYAGDVFTVSSDGHAGSNVTVTTSPAEPRALTSGNNTGAFVQQMSILGSGGSMVLARPTAEEVMAPLVSPGPH